MLISKEDSQTAIAAAAAHIYDISPTLSSYPATVLFTLRGLLPRCTAGIKLHPLQKEAGMVDVLTCYLYSLTAYRRTKNRRLLSHTPIGT